MPKAFQHPAQGCEARATLGIDRKEFTLIGKSLHGPSNEMPTSISSPRRRPGTEMGNGDGADDLTTDHADFTDEEEGSESIPPPYP